MPNPTDTNQVSLFELCKKVYELTRWKDTHSRLDDGNHTIRNEGNEVLLGSKQAPLYTSDYLLEQLPATIKNEFDGDDDYLILYKKSGSWYADYIGQFLRCKDDTALLALLKLTIALSEAGELNG